MVVALFIGMRLWRLTDFALDGDEIFSIKLARASWPNLFAGAVDDAIHPPLLYILLKLWIGLGGDSLFWLRLFPVTASALCLLPVFAMCRDLNISGPARNLAIGIMAVHPYALYYSQHLRMYCLLMLAGLLSAWRFEQYFDAGSTRNLALLGAANLFLAYTQYYGWCVVLLEFAYLLWKAPLRKPGAFLLATVPVAILFAPWAWYAGQVLHHRGLEQNLGWISRPVFSELNWFWVELTGFAEFYGHWYPAKLVLCVLIPFVLFYRRYAEPRVHFLMLLWIAPAPIAFAVSQWLPASIWGYRHLLFAIWPFALLFADAVWRMPRWISYPAIAVIGAWGAYAAAYHATENRKLPFDALVLAMLDAEQSTSRYIPLYSIDPFLHYPIEFYLDSLAKGDPGPLGPRFSGPSGSQNHQAELSDEAERFESFRADSVDEARESYFWVAWSDTGGRPAPTPPQLLEQRRGCRVGAEISQHDNYHAVRIAPITCP
jgi:hypothetical protein